MASFPPEKLKAISEEVAALLKEKKETVAVAETVCSNGSQSTLMSIKSG
jgi:nicotinamide mononucleotide (NMN) deamidase PncC